MKRYLLLLTFIFLSQIIVAQTPAATPVSPNKKESLVPASVTRDYYCCQSCEYTAKVLRSCPVHQSMLVRVGDWYCTQDGKSFAAGGRCPQHYSNLVLMEMKYTKVTPKPADLKKAEPVNK